MPTRSTVAGNAGLGGAIAIAAQTPRNVLRVTFILALAAQILAPLSHYRVRASA